MKFDLKDVEFEAFKGRGPGGQHRNVTLSCVRATHRPTGVTVQATSERSQHQNKAEAIKLLLGKLARLSEDRRKARSRQRYESQTDAAFGHAIRTVRMCGNEQNARDHRTGAEITLGEFQRGRIDPLIEAYLRSER